MLCTVYPLRFRGKRLTEAELRAACAVGTLSVHNYSGTSAHLVDQSFHSPLGALHDARVLWLTERGILIAGKQTYFIGRGGEMQAVEHRQTWWCVPSADQQRTPKHQTPPQPGFVLLDSA